MRVEIRQTDPDYLGVDFVAKPATVKLASTPLVEAPSTRRNYTNYRYDQIVVHIVAQPVPPGRSFVAGQVDCVCGLRASKRDVFQMHERWWCFRSDRYAQKASRNLHPWKWYRLCKRCLK